MYTFIGLVVFLSVVALVMMACMLQIFKLTLLQVYTIFLSLREKHIRLIDSSCRKLLKKINVKQDNLLEIDEERMPLKEDEDN